MVDRFKGQPDDSLDQYAEEVFARLSDRQMEKIYELDINKEVDELLEKKHRAGDPYQVAATWIIYLINQKKANK